ncbi:MAG: Aminomethyltransferase [Planctomycetota bacterium]|jgi:aminomethyltransferase
MTAPLRTTPLHQWHLSQNARMAEFAGYDMPIQYTSIVNEHVATRQKVTLFDISHMGRLRFEGSRSAELLDYLLTRRVRDMVPGQVRYSLVTNVDGGILDDVLVYCLESPSGRNYFLLVVNASNREKIVKWILPHLADYPDIEFNDVTDTTAMIAVQGPLAIATCTQLLPPAATRLEYYHAKVTEQFGKACIVSRTGYTGEDGLELIVRADDANRVWENLLLSGRQHGILAAGLGARDTLRLEAGMPLYGHELDEQTDPYQAGLAFAVQLKERSFVGSDAIASRKNDPSLPVRVGLMIEGRRAAREGSDLIDSEGRRIGRVSSGTFSPTLQNPIAMAYVQRNFASAGTTFDADIRGSRAAARVVPLPFYKRPQPVTT